MPKSEVAEYIGGLPESGKCAEAPDNWPLDDDWYQVSAGEQRLREKVAPDLSGPVFQEEKLRGLRNALAEIESECKTPGWDGYEAAPLSSGALEELEALLELLPPSLPAPDIVPEPTGSIGLEWRRGNNAILVLSVQGERVITYAAVLGMGTKRYGTERFVAAVPEFIQKELFPYFLETA